MATLPGAAAVHGYQSASDAGQDRVRVAAHDSSAFKRKAAGAWELQRNRPATEVHPDVTHTRPSTALAGRTIRNMLCAGC